MHLGVRGTFNELKSCWWWLYYLIKWRGRACLLLSPLETIGGVSTRRDKLEITLKDLCNLNDDMEIKLKRRPDGLTMTLTRRTNVAQSFGDIGI